MNTTSVMHDAHIQAKTQGGSFISGKTLGICLGLIALAVVAVRMFNLSYDTLLFAGILLACPLLHVWMMKGGGHK